MSISTRSSAGNNTPGALRFAALLFACLLAPIALVLLMPLPASLGYFWDLANGVGYLSLALCLLLFVYAGRARIFPPYSGRFFANLHRDLGYLALAMALFHAGLLLYREPLLVEHLKPTAPLHMLAGTLALLLMTLLVLSSLPRVRRRIWLDYHRFRHLHAVLSVSVVSLTLYHVVESGYYLNHPWKIALLSAVAAGVTLAYALRRHGVVAGAVDRTRNSARYSHLISYSAALLSLVVIMGLVALAGLVEQPA